MSSFTVLPVVLQLFMLLFLASPATPCTEQDKHDLLQFLAGLSRDGGLTTSWRNNGTDCCEWEGISCNGDGAVTGVSLESKGLEGPISPFLANLTSLLRVNLLHNSFSGGLPVELMFSGSIIVLDVNFSRLNGPLPKLPSLVATDRPLQVLNISSNLFSSQFPSAIGKLKVLKAGNNNLSGILPVETFHATLLEYLSFPNNALQGKLDGAHIVKLSNLATLDLGGNHFSARIPLSIGLLKRLEELHLGSNNMSGELPSTLGNCTNLRIIDLKFNNFIGDLGKNLQLLVMDWCSLTGRIPTWLSKLTNLKILLLASNRLTGPMPRWINSLNHLFLLDISNNSLTGKIPITLMEMPMLKLDKAAIYLDSNLLDLPTFYVGPSLQYRMGNAWPKVLRLEIPQSICNLTNLQGLDWSNNHLTGAIPAALENLHFLSHFNISNNDLGGPIPTTGQLSTFPTFSFDRNPKLCGSLLIRDCSSVEEAPVYIISAREYSMKVIFAIAFGLFFGVGVLYDQLVLFRYFG
ncbi:uncharacterized protein [Aegilops tauschii subsp. strangulata]|uniref:Tyrosine-sulfated glycopeptide receptor 1 n=1 Tax=Aegilops tauschii TaxID=37682 RepID=N1QUK0_AEGTA